jgi:16S rRNA (guanine(966)-N(2))-methyltransferase RsmD
VRVIAGRFKGRRLLGPKWAGLRPTSDRLRETLFEILTARLQGARVLDLYAGTGALGIEALSRGAAHVTFVECDRRAAALIGRNLAACGVSDGYTMMPIAVEAAEDRLDGQRFDLVLLDPPYDSGGVELAVTRAGRWLSGAGMLVLEHASRSEAPARPGALVLVRRVVAGDSALAFYAHAGSDETHGRAAGRRRTRRGEGR